MSLRPAACKRRALFCSRYSRRLCFRLDWLLPILNSPDASGTLVRLSQYRGKSAVVVYFYPKDDTGILHQAGMFVSCDQYPAIPKAQMRVVIGISDDSIAHSHQKFQAKYNLAVFAVER